MKSVQEILAEIDRRIGREDRGAEYLGFSTTTLYSELRELKEFILSGECEHEFKWVIMAAGGTHMACQKCGAIR